VSSSYCADYRRIRAYDPRLKSTSLRHNKEQNWLTFDMSKESKTKEKSEEISWKYDGSEDGWDKFDRRMHRYARKKWGPEIGDKFW